MKKILNKLDVLSFLIVICILTICFVGSILVVYRSLTLKEYSHFILLFLPIEIVVYTLSKLKNKSITKTEILLFILVILSSVSFIHSIDKKVALWGFYNRYEGLVMIIFYYFTALITSTLKDNYYKKIIVYYIILIGCINVGYGILQVLLLSNPPEFLRDSWKYARGFQGNSMYFSSLISICYFILYGYFIYNKKNKRKILSIILLLLFTIGSVISGSMALFCTTILLFIWTIVSELFGIRKPNFSRRRLFKIIGCILVFILISFLFIKKDSNYKRDVNSLKSEVKQVTSRAQVDDKFGTGRIYIWKNALSKAKENLLWGVGTDNFYYAFTPRLIDPVSTYQVDKAHNDYLQRLVCEGLLSLVVYIIFLAVLFFENVREKNLFYKCIFLGFFAYIVSIFFNISVIRVAPIYWIIVGLLMSKKNDSLIEV